MKLQEVKRQAKLQEWASQISDQSQSGMTVKKWCEAAGIGYKNFYRRKKCVQEEFLEALEAQVSKSQIAELSTQNNNKLTVPQEPPIFAPITVPQTKGAALTVWIGTYAVDVQNGADAGTIDQVLKVVSRL